jgi:hypothetical protein
MHDWINLTSHYGTQIKNPSKKRLRKIIKELFESNDGEHPDAWIECGTDGGPLYSLSIFSNGYAMYTKYSDADMTEELESKKIENVDENKAYELWKNLIEGKI